MQYRILGRTGLKVSVIGLGGIPITVIPKGEAVKTIRAAIDLGINIIHTASTYGESEERIGEAIRARRDRVFLVVHSPPFHSLVRTLEEFKTHVDRSFEKLGVDKIDIYQLGTINTREEFQRAKTPGGPLDVLKELKRKGKIHSIGVTSHGAPEVSRVLIQSGEFESIMLAYNVVGYHLESSVRSHEDMERVETEIFPLAEEHEVGVMVMKPLAGGVLLDDYVRWRDEDVTMTVAIRPEDALRFVLSRPTVTTAVIGMSSVREVQENVSTGNTFTPLSKKEEETVRREAAKLGSIFCRRCGHCLERPCPVGINIPVLFKLQYGLRVKLRRIQEDAVQQYRALPVKADECTECGSCEELCPYDIPIIDGLKDVTRDFDEMEKLGRLQQISFLRRPYQESV